MFSNQTLVSATLPAMAIRGRIPLPNNEIRIDVGRKESIAALKEAVEGNKYIVLFVQHDHNMDDPGIDNISKNGIIAKIIYNMEGQNIQKVKMLGIVRCKLIEFVEIDPFWKASIITLPIENDNLDKELAYVRLLIEELQSGSKDLFEGNAELANVISQGVTADKLTDVLAYNLPLDLNSKMKYLTTPNVGQRLRFMLEDLRREKYIKNLETDIEKEVRKTINESQKEYYLREKMKVIQDELGDKVKKDTDIEDMKKKILSAKMPKSMEEKALSELNRYSSL
ncbi:MAG: LON peptidase substrate-binding domain-containing protein, partial [Bacilli bacterium]|nr:LON peptidase substrate-binding domain-containing protein [Bacilli bacterium]